MDKLKVKLHLQAADRATDELIKAAQAGDFRQVGNQEHRLREALYSLRVELGIVRDLADLKPEPPQGVTCPECKGAKLVRFITGMGVCPTCKGTGIKPAA